MAAVAASAREVEVAVAATGGTQLDAVLYCTGEGGLRKSARLGATAQHRGGRGRAPVKKMSARRSGLGGFNSGVKRRRIRARASVRVGVRARLRFGVGVGLSGEGLGPIFAGLVGRAPRAGEGDASLVEARSFVAALRGALATTRMSRSCACKHRDTCA